MQPGSRYGNKGSMNNIKYKGLQEQPSTEESVP